MDPLFVSYAICALLVGVALGVIVSIPRPSKLWHLIGLVTVVTAGIAAAYVQVYRPWEPQ